MAEANIFPFPYHLHDFANGLRLVTVPVPYPNIVSLYIVVHTGSRNEVEEGRSGFAHFFEHMMFRGTPAFPPDRYEAVLQETGASSNAYTDDDRTVYHTTLTRADFEAVLAMEADRFMNLAYSLEDFQTEALAVYGEYNKDSTEPVNKLFEVLRDTAFDRHTYKHTTMGFLRDVERMPTMYDYSRTFFDRFYRPEHTTLIVAGDVDPDEVQSLVQRHWGHWTRGAYQVSIPHEPAQNGARRASIPWPSHTLPYLLIAHKSPAYCDISPDCAALDLVSFLGFSQSSPLYEKLVLDDQSVDILWASNSDHIDPYLFTVMARLKDPARVSDVESAVLDTLHSFTTTPIDARKLEEAKSHLRYRFALSLNNTESVASNLAHYISLRRTPETIDRLYRLYAQLTPDDILRVARWCFQPATRTTVTLQQEAA